MKTKPLSGRTIKSWSKDDQPRYKLRTKGREALSDSELLAILVGSGTASTSALDLCKEILSSVDGDLDSLSLLSIEDLMSFKGVGEAKAITIAAALELGRRRQFQGGRSPVKIMDSTAAFKAIAPMLQDKKQEEFWILFLSHSNQLIQRMKVGLGGISSVIVDTRIIFQKCIQLLSTKIILCHNHPSGQLAASAQDVALTKKIIEGGKILDIQIVDHLIICQGDYFSFKDEGII